jgi:hypothetical protein
MNLLYLALTLLQAIDACQGSDGSVHVSPLVPEPPRPIVLPKTGTHEELRAALATALERQDPGMVYRWHRFGNPKRGILMLYRLPRDPAKVEPWKEARCRERLALFLSGKLEPRPQIRDAEVMEPLVRKYLHGTRLNAAVKGVKGTAFSPPELARLPVPETYVRSLRTPNAPLVRLVPSGRRTLRFEREQHSLDPSAYDILAVVGFGERGEDGWRQRNVSLLY